jgi:hypothetical protein
MRRSLVGVVLVALSVSAVPSLADQTAPTITVTATTTSRLDIVHARIEVCPEGEAARCYKLHRRVTCGETAELGLFLSVKVSPFPSLLGELSTSADGRSLDYRLELVSGVIPVTSVAGSVPLTSD